MADNNQKLEKLEKFYSSKTLKLAIYQYYTEFSGFKLSNNQKNLFIPVSDPNKLVINLQGVNKDLTVKELQKYIKICMNNSNTKISKEAKKFFNKYPRLCTI